MNFKDLSPYHGVEDREKFNALVESMTENGWVGTPLVTYGGALLNGSHRFAAACEVAKDKWDFEVPTVELTEEFDLDEEELQEALEYDNWQVEVTRMAWNANSELAKHYGLDIH